MSNETQVNETEARILGGLAEDVSVPAVSEESTTPSSAPQTTPVPAPKEEALDEPAPTAEAAPATPVEKVISAKKQAFEKEFALPTETPETEADLKVKYEESQKQLEEYKKKEESQKIFAENQSAYQEVTKAMGKKFTPEVDQVLAKLIEGPTWDKLQGLTSQQRMLMLAQTALAMVEEDDTDTKLVKEVEEDIKSRADVLPKDLKNVELKKRTAADAMAKWKTTGDDADLEEAFDVENMLKATLFSGKD